MERTILITECEKAITKEHTYIYGRYDPVTLNRKGYKVISAFKQKFEMTDEEFAKHGRKKGDRIYGNNE